MTDTQRAVSCGNCSVRRLCLPAGLSQGDIDKLEQITRKKKIVKSGESLFRTGDPFANLYAIRSGSFKSAVIAADGDTQVTHFALPGELLGLDAYSGRVHPSYAEALEDSSVCVLPFSQLETLAQQVPALQQQIYSIFSEELKQENDILMLLGKRSADTRLAALLINISSRYARRGYSASRFVLSMPRTDIANYLGLTAETVSRLFSRFQKEKLIRASGRDVEILDLIGLSEVAGTHCGYEGEG
ncbi:fumarate/nitrate reduction transcriptional regulator Fnr [Microbulbifer thermotolerans]|uniref:Transcriptional regulator n=1 Tax=Microbulbifer thermotolerans TaxID=252514 RepID=A0A143HNM7_MICTH|nr:fumarate/nitrate reduction transcriptional regulator Fnr [Microbulbifer thermotolerans]AMX03319.1 transcriptional regulator [Microbulbifer thermotolerans]MCX2780819.1 fumarate/nitrate reduction transcriptional regulator Fnr [Microbulbifer thermotolerans]MCX2784126.1 fumarate/nitrate reduction transcriptional regulator Fnr [Microbulbifer thermotolerans]MCX2794413.1 fumarate/nitrate reduction transcriptional regulator Fnr [Microbulbifer thermotolerans]MCX2801052.1 fumarate/nitrate reduction t